jgi:hypothetical protein
MESKSLAMPRVSCLKLLKQRVCRKNKTPAMTRKGLRMWGNAKRCGLG